MWNVILLLSELVWFRLVNYSHSRNLEGFPHGLFETADSPSQCHRLAFFCTTSLCSYICRNFSRRPNQVLPKISGKETNLLIQSFKVWIPTFHVLKPQSLKSQENVIQWIPHTKSYHEFLWPYLEAINMCMMLLGRIIAGFSVGLLSGNAPVYTSEIAPPKLRGALVTGFQFAITVRVAQDCFGR